MSNTLHEQQRITQTDLHTIFAHFPSQDIEDFYQLYQLWSLQQRRTEVVARIHELEQQIAENEVHLNAISPPPIALATLSLFRAIGVDDIDLLDCMLERGDTWLDHTLQLFLHCERLDMLEGNATQWCRHALEGAYDWIGSMADINMQNATDDTLPFIPAISSKYVLGEIEALPNATEEDFLKKLLSEDDGESVRKSNISTTSAGDATLSQEDSISGFPPIEVTQMQEAEDTNEHVYEPSSAEEDIEYTAPNTLPEVLPENDLIETAPEDQALDEEQETMLLEALSPSIPSEVLPENDLIETAPEDQALDEEQETMLLEALSPPSAIEDTATQPEELIDPPGQLASFPEQVLNAEQIVPGETEQYQQIAYATRKRSKAYSLKQKKEPKKHRFHQSKHSHKKKK